MNKITHNNHYLSQMYLKRFSKDSININIYNLLVPHENYPLWECKPIRHSGSIEDIYTTYDGKNYDDELEKLFATDVEGPAKNSLEKVINGEDLTDNDYDILNKFIIIHIVRSPLVFDELMSYSNEMIPLIMNTYNPNTDFSEYTNRLYEIKLPYILNNCSDRIVMDYVIGKNIYLNMLKIFMNKCDNLFKDTKFAVASFDESVNIPTSDNPVVVVSKDNYGRCCYDKIFIDKGSFFIFPVTNNKAIYGVVGKEIEPKINFDKKDSLTIKNFIIDNPCNMFISKEIDDYIVEKKQRTVSHDKFLEKIRKFKNVNNIYFEHEVKYLNNKKGF